MVCKDPATVQLLEVSNQLQQRYLMQSQACPMPFLIRALEISNKCDIDYRAANNKRLHLEIALMKMCALCSQSLNMPTAQAQPVPVAQNRPAVGSQPAASRQPVSTSQPTVTAKAPEPVQKPAPTPTSTPQPQTPHQQAPQQPNSPTVQQPTKQQPTTSTPSTPSTPSSGSGITSTPAQPIVRPRGTTSSVSISKAMQQAEQKAEEAEETWDTPFTQEQLVEAWADFVNRYKTISPNFAAALGKYTPKLIGTSEIHFSVDNRLFEYDTEGISALKHHLHQSLHNNQFELKPEVMERPAEIEAYTDKDKFEKMVEEQPFLRTLQTELKLEGDL